MAFMLKYVKLFDGNVRFDENLLEHAYLKKYVLVYYQIN